MIQQTLGSENLSLNTSTSTLKSILTLGFGAGLIAAFLNALLYFLAAMTQGGLFIQAGQGSESIALASILALSFIPSILAAGLYWALARFTKFPKTTFLGFAFMVFAGFFFGPLNAASNTFTLLTLELMHAVAAIPIIVLVLKSSTKLVERGN